MLTFRKEEVKKNRMEKNAGNVKYQKLIGWCLAKCIFIGLIFQLLIGQCNGIKCYKCAVTVEKYHSYEKNATIVTPMCSKFSESEEYIVDCPYSTMCLKTISKLYLQNSQQQETVTRGCAAQKDTKQVFNNGRWNQEHSVQEVYEEACSEFSENTMAASLRTHCYCRGNLCNSSKQPIAVNTVMSIILGAFIILAYALTL